MTSRVRAYLASSAVISIATVVGLLAFPYATLADITMLYLIAIALASPFGRGPAILASTLAVVAFDIAFVPPRFTLAVADARYALTFATMFGAGIVISTLMSRLRRQQLDRLRAAEEAQRALIRAHTEELRSSLLSAVSHDLRTPLAVITGAATTLRDDRGKLAPEVRDELLGSIVEDARRLETILGNLLQLTRVESGVAPHREWIPLDELVGAALTRLEDAVGERPIVLDIPHDVSVHVDAVLFEQVLINLVDNALKHGAPPVEISARMTDEEVTVVVVDHGAGVASQDRERLFERFARASTAPGAGLGLAVVRAIVEAHDGRIVLDAAPAGGARFTIHLPVVGTAPAVPGEVAS